MDLKMVSPIYKMPQREFVAYMFRERGKPFIMTASLIFLILLILGIAFDLRWIVVALMFLFIIIPAIAAWLYFDFGMRSSTAFNVLPHSLEWNDESLVISIVVPDLSGDSDTDGDTPKTTVKTLSFPLVDCGAPIFGLKGTIVPIHTRPEGFLWIPITFDNESDDPEMLKNQSLQDFFQRLTKLHPSHLHN